MVWNHELMIRLHQQDKDTHCAAACAQMTIDFFNKRLEDQGNLYKMGLDNSNPVYWGEFCDSKFHDEEDQDEKDPDKIEKGIDPDGLKYILNNFVHRIMHGFAISESSEPEKLTDRIIGQLIHQGAPLPVLVEDAQHWVLVRGVELESKPETDKDAELKGFWINDPWPACYYNVPPQYTRAPPHGDNDACGCEEIPNYGKKKNYITSQFWFDTYLTPVDFLENGRPIVVAIPYSEIELTYKRLPYMPRKLRPEVSGIIRPDEIKKLVIEEVKAHGLDKSTGKSPDELLPSKPTLVRRLDRPDSYYYIIPFKKQKAITAIAIMDANQGLLGGFSACEGPTKKLFLSRKEAMEQLSGRTIDAGKGRGILVFDEGTFSVDETMVWKPCRESLSPYYPFHVATIGDKQVYIGYDGSVYTELHVKRRFC